MSASQLNPELYRTTTRHQWQSAAKAWNDWGGTLGSLATETMFDIAAVDRGSRLLDIAVGAGDQSMQAAGRIGSDGYLLATGISSNILEYAAAAPRAKGFDQVKVRVMDGEELVIEPGSFDAVISRVGLIYFPDQQRALPA